MKKLFALILSLCLTIGCLPFSVLAEPSAEGWVTDFSAADYAGGNLNTHAVLETSTATTNGSLVGLLRGDKKAQGGNDAYRWMTSASHLESGVPLTVKFASPVTLSHINLRYTASDRTPTGLVVSYKTAGDTTTKYLPSWGEGNTNTPTITTVFDATELANIGEVVELSFLFSGTVSGNTYLGLADIDLFGETASASRAPLIHPSLKDGSDVIHYAGGTLNSSVTMTTTTTLTAGTATGALDTTTWGNQSNYRYLFNPSELADGGEAVFTFTFASPVYLDFLNVNFANANRIIAGAKFEYLAKGSADYQPLETYTDNTTQWLALGGGELAELYGKKVSAVRMTLSGSAGKNPGGYTGFADIDFFGEAVPVKVTTPGVGGDVNHYATASASSGNSTVSSPAPTPDRVLNVDYWNNSSSYRWLSQSYAASSGAGVDEWFLLEFSEPLLLEHINLNFWNAARVPSHLDIQVKARGSKGFASVKTVDNHNSAVLQIAEDDATDWGVIEAVKIVMTGSIGSSATYVQLSDIDLFGEVAGAMADPVTYTVRAVDEQETVVYTESFTGDNACTMVIEAPVIDGYELNDEATKTLKLDSQNSNAMVVTFRYTTLPKIYPTRANIVTIGDSFTADGVEPNAWRTYAYENLIQQGAIFAFTGPYESHDFRVSDTYDHHGAVGSATIGSASEYSWNSETQKWSGSRTNSVHYRLFAGSDGTNDWQKTELGPAIADADIVTLFIGLNDYYNANTESLEATMGRYKVIVDRILEINPAVKFYLTDLPLVRNLRGINDALGECSTGNGVRDYNNAIKELCASSAYASYDITFVSFNDDPAVDWLNGGYRPTDDGHPNPKGNRVLGNVMAEALLADIQAINTVLTHEEYSPVRVSDFEVHTAVGSDVITAASLDIGESLSLEGSVTPADAEVITLIYTSDNEAVVTVDKYGRLTAVSSGTANVTITALDSLRPGETPLSKTIAVFVSDQEFEKIGDSSAYETVLTNAFADASQWSDLETLGDANTADVEFKRDGDFNYIRINRKGDAVQYAETVDLGSNFQIGFNAWVKDGESNTADSYQSKLYTFAAVGDFELRVASHSRIITAYHKGNPVAQATFTVPVSWCETDRFVLGKEGSTLTIYRNNEVLATATVEETASATGNLIVGGGNWWHDNRMSDLVLKTSSSTAPNLQIVGANIRLEETDGNGNVTTKAGVRFGWKLGKNFWFNALWGTEEYTYDAGKDTLEFGTLVIPQFILEQGNYASVKEYFLATGTNGLVLDIVAQKFLSQTDDALVFTGVLVDIPPIEWATELVAVSYVRYRDTASDAWNYVFASEEKAQSYKGVAQLARQNEYSEEAIVKFADDPVKQAEMRAIADKLDAILAQTAT